MRNFIFAKAINEMNKKNYINLVTFLVYRWCYQQTKKLYIDFFNF